MDENKFWQIVEESKRGAGGSQAQQERSLRILLDRLDLTEIVAFVRNFDEMRAKSYRHDLWGAAYLINGGCSDDGFEYFQRALIAEGREKFYAAMQDPDSLADWMDEEAEFEGIYYVAIDAYRAKTGTEVYPTTDVKLPKEPVGESWEEDELEELFPRIAQKFGYA